MKFTVPHFRTGDLIEGIVEEVMRDQQLVVSFQGDLIRVKNVSVREFKKGDSLMLVVSSISPLQFQLFQEAETRQREWTI